MKVTLIASGAPLVGNIASAVLLLALASCNWTKDSNAETEFLGRIPDGTAVNLTLHGYNYTNRYIDDYRVDGSGGGNLFVSGPGSAGGGSLCCATYIQGIVQPKFMVKWQTDACIYTAKSINSSETFKRIHNIYKEVEVTVESDIPYRPHYFEVHFYPDGHVEAAITENASTSRLPLTKDREDRSEFRTCPDDKKPEA